MKSKNIIVRDENNFTKIKEVLERRMK